MPTATRHTALKPREMALRQLRESAGRTRASGSIVEELSVPKRIVTVSIPTATDDGSFEVFTGCRVQHSMEREP